MRIHRVKKCRKDWRCTKCGKLLPKGSAFRWWKHRNWPTTRWCMEHGYPKPSNLTTSDKLTSLYLALEGLEGIDFSPAEHEDLAPALEDVASIVDDAASNVDEAREGYQESLDNVLEHFPSGCPVSDDLEEKISELETWYATFEDTAQEIRALADEEDESIPFDDLNANLSTRIAELIEEITGNSPFFL